jgi:hypothetical protein
MQPQAINAAFILAAFIVFRLWVMLRWMAYEMNKQPKGKK